MGIYRPEEYGAKADGKTMDTAALQAAIDACKAAGGGRVELQPGATYLSGSLRLYGNMEFHLPAASRLVASGALGDYIALGGVDTDETRGVGTPVSRKPAYVFLYAKDADDLRITGDGTIDANCYAFVHRVSQYYVTGDFYPRPTTVYLEHCDHLTVRDVTLCNAPFWTLHVAGSDDVLIQGIRILNPLDVANSDGIDPDHCSNVRIVDCHVVCADDCICLKTTQGNSEYGPTRNVLISGCTLTSTSAAIKIGTEGVGDFENVIVKDCVIDRSNRGISVQIRDGGHVKNVVFQNIHIDTRCFSTDWWGTGEPIAVTSYSRDQSVRSGNIEGLTFRHITGDSENGVLVSGAKGRIKGLRFEDVRLKLHEKSRWGRSAHDLRPGATQPEFLEADPCAFTLRDVEKVSFRDVVVEADDTYGLLDDGSCEGIEGGPVRA